MTRPQRIICLAKFIGQTSAIVLGCIILACIGLAILAVIIDFMKNNMGPLGIVITIVLSSSLGIGGLIGKFRYDAYLEDEQRIMNRLKEP